MLASQTWLLPDGVQDVLPKQAAQLEQLRRRLLDTMTSYGYQLVITPLIEYIESLLVNANDDLDLLTFKIIDQQSGRLMGVTADITPQVARIDAHVNPTSGIARYCYASHVLHTTPQGLATSRMPLQIGAELFGSAHIHADIEVLDLLVNLLKIAGFEQNIYIDLGHVQIFKSLAAHAGLSAAQESTLFDIFQRKSFPELVQFCQTIAFGSDFILLCKYGYDITYLQQHLSNAALANTELNRALTDLCTIEKHLKQKYPHLNIGIDAAELRGYHYHTGLVFTAYSTDCAAPLAKGGRYDGVGELFGKVRPATGFSCDLKLLIQHITSQSQPVIAAPAGFDSALQNAIASARNNGAIVIQSLDSHEKHDSLETSDPRFTHQLVCVNGEWLTQAIAQKA